MDNKAKINSIRGLINSEHALVLKLRELYPHADHAEDMAHEMILSQISKELDK